MMALREYIIFARKNRTLLAILCVAFIFLYILYKSSKTPSTTITVKNKRVFRASHFRREARKNDTFFKLLTEQKFLFPESQTYLQNYFRPDTYPLPPASFSKPELNIYSDFNPEYDVMVYLHIQKVGGTIFNNHLLKDLDLPTPCECEGDILTKPCHCRNKHGNIWLFSWFSVGWPCGLHADWTMLHECVEDAMDELEGKTRSRRYFYVTLLRDPVSRYLSEWRHQRQGHHWQDVQLRCDGKPVTLFDVRPCFNTRTWEGVTFKEFMDCSDNLATNRQTRMIADLTKSKCYHRNKLNRTIRGLSQLESANINIAHMAFFGLTEHQDETQRLFELSFKMQFKAQFERIPDDDGDELITDEEFIRMMTYIDLDIQLYANARALFMERFRVHGK